MTFWNNNFTDQSWIDFKKAQVFNIKLEVWQKYGILNLLSKKFRADPLLREFCNNIEYNLR